MFVQSAENGHPCTRLTKKELKIPKRDMFYSLGVRIILSFHQH